MHARLCVCIRSQFSMRVGRSTFPGTRVFPPPFRVLFSIFCPLFFSFLKSLAQKFDTRFSLCFDHPAAFPPPPFRDVFYYFPIILYPSRFFRDCCMLFLQPSSLSLSLSLIVGTIKKNSQASFAPIAVFILSIGLYLIRRILASYYVRGNIKAN